MKEEKSMKKTVFIAIVFAVLTKVGVFAADVDFKYATAESFEVSRAFSDNMVLQQNEDITVWGTSECEGKIINARLGDSLGWGEVKDGKWEIKLAQRSYSKTPLTLEVYGEDNRGYTAYENITVGDVWWFMGQSNIEYSTAAAPESDDFYASITGNESVYVCHVEKDSFSKGKYTPWRKLSPYSARASSALACFTAKKLDSALNSEVPIGIMSLGYSGNEISAFMPSQLTKYTSSIKDSAVIYDNVISYIEKMPIRGIVWYQGEADAANYSDYALKLKSYISYLREVKNQDNYDFPIYAIELSPCFDDASDTWRQFIDFGQVRAQTGGLTLRVNNFYVCPTSDLWNDRAFSNSLHPDNKETISNRLSMMLLSKEYAFGNEQMYFAPSVKSVTYSELNGKFQVCMEFEYTADGLVMEKCAGFSVVGENWKSIDDAKIELKDNMIYVTAKERICAVEYNVKTDNVFSEDIFLKNSNGMPAAAFAVNISYPAVKIADTASVDLKAIMLLTAAVFAVIVILEKTLLKKKNI